MPHAAGLPPELWREILADVLVPALLSARPGDDPLSTITRQLQRDLFSLLRVCRLFHDLVLPFLYTSIDLRAPLASHALPMSGIYTPPRIPLPGEKPKTMTDAFAKTLRERPGLGRWVRRLYLSNSSRADAVREVFEACGDGLEVVDMRCHVDDTDHDASDVRRALELVNPVRARIAFFPPLELVQSALNATLPHWTRLRSIYLVFHWRTLVPVLSTLPITQIRLWIPIVGVDDPGLLVQLLRNPALESLEVGISPEGAATLRAKLDGHGPELQDRVEKVLRFVGPDRLVPVWQ